MDNLNKRNIKLYHDLAKFEKESDILHIINDIKQIKLTVNKLITQTTEFAVSLNTTKNEETTRKSKMIENLISKLKTQSTNKRSVSKQKGTESTKVSSKLNMAQNKWIDSKSHDTNKVKTHVKAINEITSKELNDILEDSKGMSDEDMPSLLKKIYN